jgi:hypothetical protein
VDFKITQNILSFLPRNKFLSDATHAYGTFGNSEMIDVIIGMQCIRESLTFSMSRCLAGIYLFQIILNAEESVIIPGSRYLFSSQELDK